MVALKCTRLLCLVEDARTRTNELLMELTLMITARPALPIQGLKRPSALTDAIECIHAHARTSAFAEILHRTQHSIWLRRTVCSVVGVVQVLQREHIAIETRLLM